MYILSILDKKRYREKEALNFIKESLNLKETDMTSVAQVIEQRGMQQGMQQGREEGFLATARNMLADKEPVEKIMKWTGLSRAQLQSL